MTMPIVASATQPAADLALGLWLDAFNAHLATADAADNMAPASPGHGETVAIPPAVLLPRFRDEPLDVDFAWPPHPRGSGDIWPPEARVDPPALPGRVPLGYAWPMLRYQATWRWPGAGGRPATITAPAAIAELAAATARQGTTSPNQPIALAVSDALDPKALPPLQTALQRALPGAVLVGADEAVAAAVAPTATHSPTAGSHDATGPLLHLHMGFDLWYAHALELTDDPPAKRLQQTTPVIEPVPGIGLGLLHAIAERAIGMSYKRSAPASLWQLLWTTPWARDLLRVLTGRLDDVPGQRYGLSPHVCRGRFLRQHARLPVQQALQAHSANTLLYPDMLGEAPEQGRLQDQLQLGQRALENLGKARPTRAIVTGDLALLPAERGRATLAEQYLHQLHPRLKRIDLQGRDLPDDILARGAARGAARAANTPRPKAGASDA